MNTRRKFFSLTLILIVTFVFAAVTTAATQSAPQATAGGPPTADIFIDGNGNGNNNALYASWSAFPADKPGSYILLKFDVGALTTGWPGSETISQATLDLAALSCNGGDNVNVSLYGMPDAFDATWTEAAYPTFAVTEVSAAGATQLVATVDGGTVNGVGAPGYYHWTDSGSGAFASWLQGQRATGTTPGIVTLMLRLNGPADSSVTFEDRELSYKTQHNCTESAGGPQLNLTSSGPTAVTLSTLRAAGPTVNWPLIVGLGVLVLVVIGGLAVFRRRAAAR